MFEREAEKYATLNARQYIHNEGIGFCTSEEEVRQAYQKGAEFGYNKYNAKKLTKAKELLRKFLEAKSIEEACVAKSEADHFLSRDEFEND